MSLNYSSSAVDDPPSQESWLPLVACCLGTFLLLAYATIVTAGLPRIGADLGAGFGALQWIIDIYTLALAALILGLGALSDHLGHRKTFLAGLAVFTAATVACGLVGSAGWLIAARAAQGTGGAAMFATIVPLLALRYRGTRRGTAFAIWGAVAGLGSAAGTIAGGVVTQFLGWRWLFLAALPLCIVTIVIAARSLHTEATARTHIDYGGIVTMTAAMGGVTYAAINGGEDGWASTGTVGGVLVALAALTWFVRVERRTMHPIMPMELFGTRSFVGVLLVAFSYYFAAFGALPAISLWMQDALGLSPLRTALVLTIQLGAFIVVSLLLSARLHGASPGRVLGGGTIVIGAACLSGVAVWIDPQWTSLIAALIVTGIGAGVVSPVLPAVAATAVPPARAGTAGAAANSVRQLGLSIGVALCGAVAHRAGANDSVVSAHGVVGALVLCALVALGGGGLALALIPSDGRRTRV